MSFVDTDNLSFILNNVTTGCLNKSRCESMCNRSINGIHYNIQALILFNIATFILIYILLYYARSKGKEKEIIRPVMIIVSANLVLSLGILYFL